MHALDAAMTRARRAFGFLLLLVVVGSVAQGETLIALGGINDADDRSAHTYAWQIEYQQPLFQRFAASFAWLNEGHLPDHHRDGAVLQAWFLAPAWRNVLHLSIGVGPYLYFDTETNTSAHGYSDAHGVGGIATASLALDLNRNWFLSLDASQVYASGDVGTRSILLGAGYRFTALDEVFDTLAAGADSAGAFMRGRQQIQAFAGRKIFNDLDSRQADTFGADYRLTLTPWAAWSATWFDDPGSAAGLHDRIASQFWLVDAIAPARLALSVGLGTYVQLGSKADSAATTQGRVSGLSGLRADWQYSDHASLIFSWYRRFTQDDEDRDILTLGVGWRFGER